MGIWLSVLGLVFTMGSAHAEPIQIDLPVPAKATNLRFRALMAEDKDQLLFSEDGGTHWQSAFTGHMRQLQLPITRQEATFGWMLLHKLTTGRILALNYADEEFDPARWHLLVKTDTGNAVISPRRVYALPSVGDVRHVRLLDGDPEGHWQVVAVQGTENQATLLFLDGHAPVHLSDRCIDTRIHPQIDAEDVSWPDQNIAERFRLVPFTVDAAGLRQLELFQRRWRAVDEILANAEHPDGDVEEAIYIDLLNSQIMRSVYIGHKDQAVNGALLAVARSIIRAHIYKLVPRLRLYALDPATTESFEELLNQLGFAWTTGLAQLEPLLVYVSERVNGRKTLPPSCQSDLENFVPPKLVSLPSIGQTLERIGREMRRR